MGDRLAERAAFWWLLLPIVFGLLLRALRRPAFFHRYVGEATPASLAAIRVLTCAILLAHVMVEDLASTAWLPRRLVEPMGVLQLLYALPIGFRGFLASPAALSVFKAVTAALLLAGAAGWRARATLPLAALGYLIFGGILRQYSAFYHAGLVPLYVLAVLVFTPCVDAWSIDRRRRASRGLPVPEPGRPAAVYGWSRYACWTVVALAYAASGLSKLRNGGLHWWDAANVRAIYYRTSLNPMHFDWGLSLRLVQAPDALFALLGLASVALEVGFLAVLFWRPARRVLPLLMILFHVAVLFLDVRGFTTISEKLTPTEVVALLNEYFDVVVDRVAAHGGTVNKFIGDAAMCIWGAPKHAVQGERSAVLCALEIQARAKKLSAERTKRGLTTVGFGIGINAGEAVAGNLGAAKRLEYTVIGDAVNLAQRLESQARAGEVLVSQPVYEKVAMEVEAAPRDPVKLKGKSKPVQLWEIRRVKVAATEAA